ncbi:hypothetical protein E2C01_057788 [Portunus trituberculatus]|uniref:Uncharacterized protein n=1 Tax=Portunus trituberculatus TaxID=210409 RepID=A0A5B7H1F8_PORTR|nr:hypothetical protein [Portunus trituberculatus]
MVRVENIVVMMTMAVIVMTAVIVTTEVVVSVMGMAGHISPSCWSAAGRVTSRITALHCSDCLLLQPFGRFNHFLPPITSLPSLPPPVTPSSTFVTCVVRRTLRQPGEGQEPPFTCPHHNRRSASAFWLPFLFFRVP